MRNEEVEIETVRIGDSGHIIATYQTQGTRSEQQDCAAHGALQPGILGDNGRLIEIFKHAHGALPRILPSAEMALKSASTALALLVGGPRIQAANLGDSGAAVIIFNRTSQRFRVVPLTVPDIPTAEHEKARILDKGGRVLDENYDSFKNGFKNGDIHTPKGLLMINGRGHTLSAAFGYGHDANGWIRKEPRITEYTLDDFDLEEDETTYLVIETDGMQGHNMTLDKRMERLNASPIPQAFGALPIDDARREYLILEGLAQIVEEQDEEFRARGGGGKMDNMTASCLRWDANTPACFVIVGDGNGDDGKLISSASCKALAEQLAAAPG